MPSVIPFGEEPIDTTLKRFKKRVIVSGILGELSRSRFYLTKSQKRRAKSAKARKRARRKERAERTAGRNQDRDFKLWVSEKMWPPDMTLKPDFPEDGDSYFFKKNPHIVQQEPSDFVGNIGIFETDDNKLVTLLVKDKPSNNDGKGRSGRWGFPGGGVKIGENKESAAVREHVEETGLITTEPYPKDKISEQKTGLHVSTFYKTGIISGKLVKGDEIEDIAVVKLSDLRGWVAQDLLFPKHRQAAEALLQKMGM